MTKNFPKPKRNRKQKKNLRKPDTLHAAIEKIDEGLIAVSRKLIQKFKEPKYPAAAITERQKARNSEYTKKFEAIIQSIERRGKK